MPILTIISYLYFQEDSPLQKQLKNILFQYETKCAEYDVSPCISVNKAIRQAISEDAMIWRVSV